VSDYSTWRDAIKAQIELVSDVGRVHDGQVYAKDQRGLLHHFGTTIDGVQQIVGWWIERPTRRVAETDMDTQNTINWSHTFTIHGVMGYQDKRDTDGIFGDLVDDVIDSLALMVRQPGDTLPGAWQLIPPRLRVQELRMFTDVLCHYAEIIIIPHKRTGF
jgi:hypothetical protein